jgi:hypothetical protein
MKSVCASDTFHFLPEIQKAILCTESVIMTTYGDGRRQRGVETIRGRETSEARGGTAKTTCLAIMSDKVVHEVLRG